MTPQDALHRGVAELRLELPDGAEALLMRYMALLEKWDRTYNLTAIREPAEVVSHHLLDSLAVVPHLPVPAHGSLADVGAGAGLPGIPIALARPHWRVTLNDSNEKKVAFLRQAAIELGLSNVAVHAGRVEQWAPQPKFALVISRAFAGFEQFRLRCAHLVASGGVLAAMTGAAPTAGDCRIVALHVPLLDAQRHLVLCPAGS
ncbi:MAG TPA: 16S rRNA (guanine(527)-N(7))-methyltransferase RsmG [Burkholderiales bacterium]|jgi:16S rRNA (guanine527-N7)-methyltransferase